MSSDAGSSPALDMPIDPSLLELEEDGDPFQDEVDLVQSSGVEDHDEDEYVGEEEGTLREIEAGPSRGGDDDVVFR